MFYNNNCSILRLYVYMCVCVILYNMYVCMFVNAIFVCKTHSQSNLQYTDGWKSNRTKLYRELHRRPLIMVLNCFVGTYIVGTYIEPNEQFRIHSIDLSNKSSYRFVIEVATWIFLSHHKSDLNLVNNPNFL